MATSDVTVTFDLLNALAVPFDATRTKVWLTFNTAEGFIIDDEGAVRMDAGKATITDAGLVTLTGIPIPGGSNPTDFQVKIHYDTEFILPGVRGLTRKKDDFGWMTVTEDATLDELIAEQYVPPTWLSEAQSLLQGYVDQGADLLAAQIALSGIDDTDSAVAGLISNPMLGPLTRAALTTSIAAYQNVFKVTTFTTAGVQATLATADLAGGGTIYMPAGAYDFSGGHVLLPDNNHPFRFVGDRIGKTVITKAANTRGFYRPTTHSNVAGPLVFEDFEVIGQGAQGNAENHTDMAIHIEDLSGSAENPYVYICRVKASKCNSEAFYTAAGFNSYVELVVDDCAFNAFNPVSGNPANKKSFAFISHCQANKIGNNNGAAAVVETVAASVIVANNHFSDVTGPGIVARGHHTVVVSGNTLLGWTGSTVSTSAAAIQIARANAIWNGPGVFNVTGNTIRDWVRGVTVLASADTDVITQATISSNTINTTKREGIWVEPFAGAIKNVHIIGNSIVDAGQDAHNTYDAIRVGYTTTTGTSGTVTRPVIQSNTVASTTATKVRYGVNIEADTTVPITVTVTDALVKDNDLRDCWATAAINDTGTGTVRVGNLPGGTVPYTYVINGTHIWPDATGTLRIKTSAPSSDTDGTALATAASVTAAVLTATKTTDQTVNNSTTVVADTELTLPVAANSVYEFGGYLRIDSSTTADFKLGLNGPGSSTASWGALGPAISVASGGTGSGNYVERTIGQALSLGGGGAGTALIARPIGRFVTGASAGNFNITFAQNTADVSDTKILAGSFITLRKIS